MIRKQGRKSIICYFVSIFYFVKDEKPLKSSYENRKENLIFD